MSKAIFPGSFDPITLGHMDIIERSAKMFDEVIVVLLDNSEKKGCFAMEERLQFMEHSCAHIHNVRCMCDHGLTVEFARKQGANTIIRGVRSNKDYEYERDIASVNRHIAKEIETILLFSDVKYSFVSSTIIKEMLAYHQDVRAFVCEEVAYALQTKIS